MWKTPWRQRGSDRRSAADPTVGGALDVVNRCLRADGREHEARGIARVVDSQSNARLEVSFVRVLGRWLFWGDYWVLGLGLQYDFAVAGTPDRRCGWILSRAAELSSKQRANFGAIPTMQGWDTAGVTPSTS